MDSRHPLITITSVHFSKLVNLGNYENEKIAAWANVEANQTPDEALAALTAWVEEQAKARVKDQEAVAAAQRLVGELEWKRNQMAAQIKEMRDTWAKGRAFLKAIGLALPRTYLGEDNDEEMPF